MVQQQQQQRQMQPQQVTILTINSHIWDLNTKQAPLTQTILTFGTHLLIKRPSKSLLTVLRHQHEPPHPTGRHHRLEAVVRVALPLLHALGLATAGAQTPHPQLTGKLGDKRAIAI